MEELSSTMLGGMVWGQEKIICPERGEDINTPLTTDECHHTVVMVIQIMNSREIESPPTPEERRLANDHLQEEDAKACLAKAK